jgi:hypothetical protein
MDTIVILERLNLPSDRTYKFVMRLPVPAGTEAMYANPDVVSAYLFAPDIDNDQLRAGLFVERIGIAELPAAKVIQDAFDATDPGNIALFQKQLAKDQNAVMPQSRPKIMQDTTDADVQALMQKIYNDELARFLATAVDLNAPHMDKYGVSFDGASWSSK